MKTIDITLASPEIAVLVERVLRAAAAGEPIALTLPERDVVAEILGAVSTARKRATFARHPLSGFGGVP